MSPEMLLLAATAAALLAGTSTASASVMAVPPPPPLQLPQTTESRKSTSQMAAPADAYLVDVGDFPGGEEEDADVVDDNDSVGAAASSPTEDEATAATAAPDAGGFNVPEAVALSRRLERRGDAGGGLCRLARRRLSRAELRQLLSNLLKDHHVFHTAGGGKRKRNGGSGGVGGDLGGGRLCRYGKRGVWRPCGLYYKRLQGRPYAYHWPIMNILGGALG